MIKVNAISRQCISDSPHHGHDYMEIPPPYNAGDTEHGTLYHCEGTITPQSEPLLSALAASVNAAMLAAITAGLSRSDAMAHLDALAADWRATADSDAIEFYSEFGEWPASAPGDIAGSVPACQYPDATLRHSCPPARRHAVGLHSTPMCEVCLTGIARAGHVTCEACAGQE